MTTERGYAYIPFLMEGGMLSVSSGPGFIKAVEAPAQENEWNAYFYLLSGHAVKQGWSFISGLPS